MTEKDVAEYIIEWLRLQEWDVWQEVKFDHSSSIHDIVAVRTNLMWIIEVKKSLSLHVMCQASESIADFVSVAVPVTPKRWYNKGIRFAEKICKAYGIGVMLADNSYIKRYIETKKDEHGRSHGSWQSIKVEQRIPPSLRRYNRKKTKLRLEYLKKIPQDFSRAGTNGGGYWTPYKQTVMNARDFLKDRPGSTAREIITNLKGHHYANDKSAYSNLATCLMTIEKKWCRFTKTKKGFKFYIRKGMEHEGSNRY